MSRRLSALALLALGILAISAGKRSQQAYGRAGPVSRREGVGAERVPRPGRLVVASAERSGSGQPLPAVIQTRRGHPCRHPLAGVRHAQAQEVSDGELFRTFLIGEPSLAPLVQALQTLGARASSGGVVASPHSRQDHGCRLAPLEAAQSFKRRLPCFLNAATTQALPAS